MADGVQAVSWYQPMVDFGSKAVSVGWDVGVAVANFAKEWFSAGLTFTAEHQEHVITAVIALAIGAVITSLFFVCCGNSNPAPADETVSGVGGRGDGT